MKPTAQLKLIKNPEYSGHCSASETDVTYRFFGGVGQYFFFFSPLDLALQKLSKRQIINGIVVINDRLNPPQTFFFCFVFVFFTPSIINNLLYMCLPKILFT